MVATCVVTLFTPFSFMYHFLFVGMLLMPFQISNKRLLDIYTRDANNTSYKEQLKFLSADKDGLEERDLVIVKHVFTNATNELFTTKKIKDEFTIILTGKDGGEKYRSTRPVSLQQLYGIIDAMPMRKEETKSGTKKRPG